MKVIVDISIEKLAGAGIELGEYLTEESAQFVCENPDFIKEIEAVYKDKTPTLKDVCGFIEESESYYKRAEIEGDI